MDTTTSLIPVDGVIRIRRGTPPHWHCHDVAGAYARTFVLPVIGPTGFVAWEQACAWSADGETSIAVAVFAVQLGVKGSVLRHALQRLVQHHLATVTADEPDVLQVWTLAPPASIGTLARWADVAPPLRALHDTWTRAAA